MFNWVLGALCVFPPPSHVYLDRRREVFVCVWVGGWWWWGGVVAYRSVCTLGSVRLERIFVSVYVEI